MKKPDTKINTDRVNKNELKEPKYDYPDISSVVSANEMTGLMNALPQNEDEFESYEDIAHTPLPANKKRTKPL